MSILIRELRLSFVWFERGNPWGSSQPIPMGFLATADGYAQEFDRMMSETVQQVPAGYPVSPSRQSPTALTPPWPVAMPQYRQWFWRYYLGVAPGNLSGKLAFQKLVPFRTGLPVTLSPAKPWVRVLRDGFIYPHGIGLVITLRLYFDRGGWPAQGITLEGAVQNAVEAHGQLMYAGTWDNSQTFSGTLGAVAAGLLNHLRGRVFGPGAIEGSAPFSVAAVIRGDTDGNLLTSRPAEGHDVHAALQGLCTLRDTWQSDKPTPFARSLLRVRQTAPGGHILYHTGQGRAIWYPASFASGERFTRKLGCYQRNLTLFHLQTEALVYALKARADLIAASEPVPAQLAQICQCAATNLHAIYASEGDTYRSSSPRAYLDENSSLKKIVDGALKDFNMEPLKYVELAT